MRFSRSSSSKTAAKEQGAENSQSSCRQTLYRTTPHSPSPFVDHRQACDKDSTGKSRQETDPSYGEGQTIETNQLAIIEPVDITDEQMKAAYDAAMQSGFNRADELYQLVIETRDAPIADRRAAEEEAARQAAEEVAAYDHITGTYDGMGPAASGCFTAASLSNFELTIAGDLHEANDGSFRASVGSKTWTFAVNENSEFGCSIFDGFHEQSREEFGATLEGLAFPSLTLIVEDGVIVRAYISA